MVTISPYQTFEDAIAVVNDSRYGLQAGVFTNDINRAFQAHRDIDVGGVIVERRLGIPSRPDAVRGFEGLRVRARGAAVRDGGDDRAPDHGPVARPALSVTG